MNDNVDDLSKVSPLGTDSDGGFFSSIFSSSVGILLFIIVVLILLLVVWFVLKKIKLRTRISHEKSSIKKDLQIWSNLSKLISGGDKTQKGKEELSANIKLIREIFSNGLSTIRKKAFARHKTPWFVLVGEPLSGKSQLIASSGNSFERARESLDPKDTECLHFCVNRETVILDVKGKVFFDNWLGGSSAEWSCICDAIKKFNNAKPVSGIILAIPADALLADDKELTTKKAELVYSELLRLASVTRMHIPVRIVITKCDCILGFREYFCELEDKVREQTVGVDLVNDSGIYNQEDFYDKWNALTQRLRDGVLGLMTSKSVVSMSYEGKNRLDLSSYIFKFPEEIAALKEKLDIYLSTIFSKRFSAQLLLVDGIYFSSSVDQGASLYPELAAYQGKAVDEVVIYDENNVSEKTFFAKNIFSSMLMSLFERARFTNAELAKRATPRFILYSIICFLSVMYLTGAIFGGTLIREPLNKYASYYDSLGKMFRNNYVQNSPLMDVNNAGSGITKFNSLMVNDTKMSRINFFNIGKALLLKEINLPFVYFPSSFVFYDGNDIKYKERYTIYNQMLIDMVFVPAARAFGYNLLSSDSLYTDSKVDALYSYIYLSNAEVLESNVNSIALIENCLKNIMLVMYPDIENDMINNLSDILDGDETYAYAAAYQITTDPNYKPSYENGLLKYIDQIQNMTVYPNLEYQVIRHAMDLGSKIREKIAVLENFEFDQVGILKDYGVSIGDHSHRIAKTVVDCIDICNELDSLNSNFLIEYASSSVGDSKDKKKDADAITLYRNQLINAAYLLFKKTMTDDIDKFISIADINYNKAESDNGYSSVLDRFKKIRYKAFIDLDADYKNLKMIAQDVNQDRLFDPIIVNGTKTNRLNYQVFKDLMQILNVKQDELHMNIRKPSEFKSTFNRVEIIFKDRQNQLKMFMENYKDLETITSLEYAAQRILNYLELDYKAELTENLFNMYPYKNSQQRNMIDLIEKVSALNYDFENRSSISTDLAREALGYFDVRNEYSPAAVNEYINPVVFLLDHARSKNSDSDASSGAAAGGDDKDINSVDNMFRRYLQNCSELTKINNLIISYTSDFVDYWSNFADSIKPQLGDYYEFHDFASKSKAYVINSQLLDIYNFSYELLSSIDKDGLSAKAASVRSDALKLLETRRKSLSVQFTNACSDVLDSWSLLPSDAVRANHYLQTLDKKLIRHGFTLVKDDASKVGNVPWWTNFVVLGTALLKADASYDTVYGLDQFQTRLYFFPILKDAAEDTMSLNPSDMAPLARELRSFGIKPPKSNPADAVQSAPNDLSGLDGADEGVDSLQEPILGNVLSGRSDLETWGAKVSKLLTMLGNVKSPVNAVVSIPSMETQRKLLKTYAKGAQNAIVRFRYIDVDIGDSEAGEEPVETERYSTVTEKDSTVIYKGDLSLSDLKLSFYRYSDQKEPEVTHSTLGKYAPLRLYLDSHGKYDAKEKAVYIPLRLVSKEGEKSVMFLMITFDKELLTPDEWPSSYNWPSINQF